MTRLNIFLFISSLALSCSATPDATTAFESTPVVDSQIITISLMDEKEDTISPSANKQSIAVQSKHTDESVNKVQKESSPLKEETNSAEDIVIKVDHSPFNEMLQAYVSNSGEVNYGAWKNDISKLNTYITQLSVNTPNDSWSKSEKLAFWINLYNASTIKLILDNAPVKSIMDIDGGKPWDREWIKVGSNVYSLNQVENDIIRPRFGDARIHFAVNCAAKSCPPLHNRAFTADNLNSTLASLTRKFINNSNFNVISENSLKLSNIFNWYASDFGDIKTYIKQYTDVEIKDKANIRYLDYNWALNSK